MKSSSSLLWMSIALFGAAGCGGGNDPYGDLEDDPFPDLASETDFGDTQSGSEGVAAQDTLSSALALDAVVDAPEESLGVLTGAYSGAAGMLGSALGDQAFLMTERQALVARVIQRAVAGDGWYAEFPDCVTVEETDTSVSVTFDCEETESDFTATLDGSIDLETDGTATTFSVRVHTAGHGTLEDVSLSIDAAFLADMTISPTAVDGELMFNADVEGSSQGMSATASYLGKVIYGVELDGPGCAVGGDIKVAVDLDVHSPNANVSVGGVGQALFGPACNQVTVSARSTGAE
ncbi:MAG TPA: hypothetical protein VKB80_27010 [Kofleriaceae bacterium]|nr:hypothetical protein [Kofleriaceae bacterium]